MSNVVLCTIAKNENVYINEGVEHHLALGFDHIYIYDNNNSSTEYVGNFIKNKDKVTIININNDYRNNLQPHYFNKFYHEYNDTFDGCAFFDVDEFLDGVSNIKKFLDQDKFKNFNQIRIKGRLFGDDGYLERDMSIPVYTFFKKEIKYGLGRCNNAKVIIRGHEPEEYGGHYIHYVITKDGKMGKSCIPSGKKTTEVDGGLHDVNYTKETVFLNHYMTRTFDEFLRYKMSRGDACKPLRRLKLKYYLEVNNNGTAEDLENYIKTKFNV